MLTIRSFIVFVLFMSMNGLSYGHGDHDDFMEPMDEPKIGMRADWILQSLVKEKKLDGSWGAKLKQDITPKAVGETQVWQVLVKNPKEKDPAKQNLYIYIDAVGNSLGVSHMEKK